MAAEHCRIEIGVCRGLSFCRCSCAMCQAADADEDTGTLPAETPAAADLVEAAKERWRARGGRAPANVEEKPGPTALGDDGAETPSAAPQAMTADDLPPEVLAVLRDQRPDAPELPGELALLRQTVPRLLDRARRAEAALKLKSADWSRFAYPENVPSATVSAVPPPTDAGEPGRDVPMPTPPKLPSSEAARLLLELQEDSLYNGAIRLEEFVRRAVEDQLTDRVDELIEEMACHLDRHAAILTQGRKIAMQLAAEEIREFKGRRQLAPPPADANTWGGETGGTSTEADAGEPSALPAWVRAWWMRGQTGHSSGCVCAACEAALVAIVARVRAETVEDMERRMLSEEAVEAAVRAFLATPGIDGLPAELRFAVAAAIAAAKEKP